MKFYPNCAKNRFVFRENLHSWHKFYTTAGRDSRDKSQLCYFPIPLWLNFMVNRFEIDCMPLHCSLFIYEFAISQKHFNSISQKAGWKLIEHHSDCTGFKGKCRQQSSENLFWWRKKFFTGASYIVVKCQQSWAAFLHKPLLGHLCARKQGLKICLPKKH